MYNHSPSFHPFKDQILRADSAFSAASRSLIKATSCLTSEPPWAGTTYGDSLRDLVSRLVFALQEEREIALAVLSQLGDSNSKSVLSSDVSDTFADLPLKEERYVEDYLNGSTAPDKAFLTRSDAFAERERLQALPSADSLSTSSRKETVHSSSSDAIPKSTLPSLPVSRADNSRQRYL